MSEVQIHTDLAEALPEPVLVFSAPGLALAWMNSAAENWLGCSLSSKLGVDMSDIAPGFQSLMPIAKHTVDTGATTRGLDQGIFVPGKENMEVSYTVFPHGDNVAIMLTLQRVGLVPNTDGQDGLAVQMIGRMLAHELKNPLTGIHGAVQLLEAGISDPADLEITELIKSEVKRIGKLADTIEDFGVIETPDFNNFNIHTVLRKALLLFQNTDNAGINFIENYDPSLPDVYGNADKLMQVVINFLANATDAVKAKHGEGRIEIQTSYRAGIRKTMPSGGIQNLCVEVKIIDNGIGVSKEMADRIFQPFVTGKANGHGLGLALVSKVIDEHGGLVTCTRNVGKTVFSVLLPENSTRNKDINL